MGPMGPDEPRRATKVPLNSVHHVRPPNNRPLGNSDKKRKFEAPKTSGPQVSSNDDKTNLF